MKKLKSFIQNYFRKLKLYFIADYKITLCLILMSAITPVISALSIKYGSDLLNGITIYLPDNNYSLIYPNMIIVFVLSLITLTMFYLNQICISKMSFQLEFVLNKRLMLAYTKSDYLDALSEKGANDFRLALNQTDTNSITSDIYLITGIIRGVIEIITYAVLLYSRLNILVILICLVIFVLTAFIDFKNAKSQNKYIVDNNKNERIASYMSSLVTGLYAAKEVILNNLSDYLISKWKTQHSKNINIQKDVQTKKFKNNLFIACITEFITLSILIVLFIMDMIPNIGEFALLTSAMLSLQYGLKSTSQSIAFMYQTQEQYSWYSNFIETQVDTSSLLSHSIVPTESAVKLINVSFKFPNQERYVLKDINVELPKGKVIAIVGENGAGKTTLINLILGLYKPVDGEILCMNKDPYEAFTKGELSDISYVSQHFSPLQAMSVRDNIYLNKESNIIDSNYNKHLSEVNINDIIGEDFGGRNLSGGQVQKIAFLRANVFDSSILILDEPTAALDPIAEMNLFNEYINNNNKEKTILLITHRLGSVRKADRILCLKDGGIIEDGTHNELMELQGHYYNMFESQAQWYRGDVI
jgi:ABC-type bacteriocin/lantibiotic exporters, contain an N-terminal double-glycine peptidase domain